MGVFSCFSQAKTSKKNFFKLPFLLLWPNLVLFLSIFQLSPWTEAVIISPGLSEVIFSVLCLPDTQCMGRHGASNKPLLLQAKLSPQVPHFYSILNFYIRMCEAGRVRAICSYLIFLPLSHLQCGFDELICFHGSVYLTPEQKWALSAQQAAVPTHGWTLLKTSP